MQSCFATFLHNCEISRFARCEMKFAHVRVANISHLRSKYFIAKRFHLPARANFVAYLLYGRYAVVSFLLLCKGYEKIIFTVCNKVSNPSKINAFRPSGEKLHQHFFTIHYYYYLQKNSSLIEKSEK